MSELSWLSADTLSFPPTSNALESPNGLLAAGGDLSPERLISAYSRGIFPWYSDGQPILWWSPDPRLILVPSQTHIGRTLKKRLRKKTFDITVDTAFEEVIRHCAQIPRDDQDGTWITNEMEEAYISLHKHGIAHSIEAWADNHLVGGLYGVSLGKAFFGESMFSLTTDASKVAFATLATQLKQWGFELIDCQVKTDLLESFGATEIKRKEFEGLLHHAIGVKDLQQHLNWPDNWTMPTYGVDPANLDTTDT